MRMLILFITLIVPAVVAAQPNPGALAAAIETELDRIPANTGLYLKHLNTGEEVAIRADTSFNSQSVIKVAIMVRAFQLAEQGKLDLDERVTLTRELMRDGSGLLQFSDLGLAVTVRDLIQHMIITSDNTATDLLATKVGGVEALNEWLAQAGYKMRKINRGWEYRRKLLARLDPRFATITAEETTGLQYAAGDNPLFAHYRALFTGERAKWVDIVRDPTNRRRRAEDTARLMVEDRNIWLGDMQARDIGRMLEAIERETIVSPESASRIRTFMRRQQAGSRRLPHYVDVPVAHKTGDAGNIANDVGIIYSRSGPIVIAVMVTGIRGSLGEAEDQIGRIAQLIVRHFDAPSNAPTVTQAPTRAKRAIQPPNYKPTPSPLTPAILIGDTLYMSGSTGGDPVTGRLVAGGFEPEMRRIMANVQIVLKEAGMTLADVVSVTAYIADMSDFPRFNEIYREYFTSTPLPTRSTVAVKELARGARLELTMTAVRTR
jgi:reactive intermediate/imine deaminase